MSYLLRAIIVGSVTAIIAWKSPPVDGASGSRSAIAVTSDSIEPTLASPAAKELDSVMSAAPLLPDTVSEHAVENARAGGPVTVLVVGSVQFASGRADLGPDAVAALMRVAESLRAGGTQAIDVVGHTDGAGSPGSNERLAERRATNVKDFLVSRGIAEGRIRTVALGPSVPMGDDRRPEGRATNRRVEIRLRQ